MEVKAIETIYNGYRFRSRLEARYAVFFGAAGLRYEYEKEGLVLDDNTYYLPDFWLPELKLWVEIKPELDYIECAVEEGSGLELRKHEKLYTCPVLDLMRRFRSSQPWPVALIVGQPGDQRTYFFGWDMSYDSAGEYEESNAAWCVVNGQVTLNVHISNPDREIYSDSLYGEALKQFTLARDYEYSLKLIENALMLARQARFEHGEKPQVTMDNVLM